MNSRLLLFSLAVAAFAVALSNPGSANENKHPIRFAQPKRIEAGSRIAGADRYFPSPVMHDIDGDNRADIVIGDLDGRVTFASRNEDGTFAAEKPLNKRDGKPLKFHNW